jgi:drug/metabolite transporter (DMT)-like permease
MAGQDGRALTTLPSNPLRGILLKIASVVVFMAMVTCIKLVSPHVPTGEVVFFRSVFTIPVILVWLWLHHDLRHGLETQNPMGHLWRGLVGFTAMGLSFTALGFLPLPEVTAIGYASPLLVTIFAAMFLGEAIRFYRLGAVALGLAGVLIVLYPRLGGLSVESATKLETVGAMAMLLSAVFSALAACFVRKLVQVEKITAIVFYFSLTTTALSLLTIPFGWVMPSAREAALLVAAGIFGGFGQILLTTSYRHAETAVIAPFDYTSMLLALAIGYSVFAEVPTGPMLGGAALVVSAGLFIIWREHRLGLERGKARKVMTPQG